MKVSLNYGSTSMTLDIPDENYLGTLSPQDIKEIDSNIHKYYYSISKALAGEPSPPLILKGKQINP